MTTLRYRVPAMPGHRVKRVFTTDSRTVLPPRRIHDEILTPIVTGKTIALGEVWTGGLGPKIDLFVAAVRPLVRGFALGHIVGPEAAPGGLALGQIWEGYVGLRDTLMRAVSGEPPSTAGVVDLVGVLEELENFRASVGSLPEANDFSQLENSLRGLEQARAAVDKQARATRSTGDARSWMARSRDATRLAIGKIRDAAAQRYGVGNQRAMPTRDSTGEVRDQLAAAGRATDMRTKVSALNDANAAFWRARTRDHLDDLLPRSGTRGALERQIGQGGGSGAPSVADINEANRRFWASR